MFVVQKIQSRFYNTKLIRMRSNSYGESGYWILDGFIQRMQRKPAATKWRVQQSLHQTNVHSSSFHLNFFHSESQDWSYWNAACNLVWWIRQTYLCHRSYYSSEIYNESVRNFTVTLYPQPEYPDSNYNYTYPRPTFVRTNPYQSTHPWHSHRTTVHIPTIPCYLEANSEIIP